MKPGPELFAFIAILACLSFAIFVIALLCAVSSRRKRRGSLPTSGAPADPTPVGILGWLGVDSGGAGGSHHHHSHTHHGSSHHHSPHIDTGGSHHGGMGGGHHGGFDGGHGGGGHGGGHH